MSIPRLRSTVAPPDPVAVKDPQPAQPPSIANTILEELRPEHNTDSNTGLVTTIDVVPDFRFPLISWMYSLSRILPNSAYLSSPYASPASLLGYTMVMYVALLFHVDSNHRFSPSGSAQTIMNDALFSSFFGLLLDFPVPDFSHNEFEALRTFLPDDIPNLAFVASLATTSFFHDFGRQFPASMFFALHNLLAGLPANTPTGTLRWRYYTTTIFSVTIGNNANVNITPGHLLGRLVRDNNADNGHVNWLNERFDALVNAMAIRAVNQNNMVGPIPFPAIANGNLANYNPYLFLTSLTPESHFSILAAIRNLAPWVNSSLPRSRPLRAYLQTGNPELCTHLTSITSLPTWNSTDIVGGIMPAPNPLEPGQLPYSAAQVANLTHYLVAPPLPTAADVDGNTVFDFAGLRPPQNPPANYILPSLTTGTQRPTPWRDPVRYVHFSTRDHVVPDMQIFAPYAATLGSLGPVIISGKIIETGDISGVCSPVPNPQTGLFFENAHYLEGSIRITRTRDGLFDATTAHMIEHLPSQTDNDFGSSFFRGTNAGLRLPLFSEGPIVVHPRPNDPQPNRRITPGALLAVHAADSFRSVNVFGSTLSGDAYLANDLKFTLWSSFRYDHRTPTGSVIRVLPTLRHIFGARARLYATTHPARRVPF